MNKKITLWRQIIVCIICMFLLSSCDFEKTDKKTYYTDADGSKSYIINENHFTFDSYNILEVIVSDNEKFILYDFKSGNNESGIGEWIKDGVSYPIAFMDHDRKHPDGKHANIVIFPDDYYGYWSKSDVEGLSPVIAQINNDTENPGLYRWSDGAHPYNWEFENTKVSVEYITYTRNDLNSQFYIPEKAARFYSLNGENISFSSDELNLWFNGKTGEGYWTLDGIDIPIIASFNVSQFSFSVRYNTTDERQGILIFSATGTSVNDIVDYQAKFILNSFPQNCGYQPNTTILIKKTVNYIL